MNVNLPAVRVIAQDEDGTETTVERGWVCPWTGAVLAHEQLAGYGNPPTSPAAPIGMGSSVTCNAARIVKEKRLDGSINARLYTGEKDRVHTAAKALKAPTE